MCWLLRWRKGAVGVACSAIALTACASMNIGSYVDRGTDFQQYRSYTWASSDRLSTGDPRLDNNPFFRQRLQSDVEAGLTTRGFEKRESGTADLVVHYHASVTQRIDISGLDLEYASCKQVECQPFVYDAGAIVLDLVDTRTNRLVWRGWAEDSLDGVIDDQDWMERKIDEAVTRILVRLPRNPNF